MNIEHEFWIDLGDIGELRATAKGCCTEAPRDPYEKRGFFVIIDSITVSVKGQVIDILPLLSKDKIHEVEDEFIDTLKDFQENPQYDDWDRDAA